MNLLRVVLRLYLHWDVADVIIVVKIIVIAVIAIDSLIFIVLPINIPRHCADRVSIAVVNVTMAVIDIILRETMVMLLPTIIIVVIVALLFPIIIITNNIIQQPLPQHPTFYTPLQLFYIHFHLFYPTHIAILQILYYTFYQINNLLFVMHHFHELINLLP